MFYQMFVVLLAFLVSTSFPAKTNPFREVNNAMKMFKSFTLLVSFYFGQHSLSRLAEKGKIWFHLNLQERRLEIICHQRFIDINGRHKTLCGVGFEGFSSD